MKSPAGFPFQRIAIAVTLSILAHSLLLWQWPQLKFAVTNEPPALQAKLTPLPKPAAKARPRKPKTTAPINTIPDSTASGASVRHDVTTATPAPAPIPEDKVYVPPLLPKHALLRFSVQYADGTFKVGEVTHRLESRDGRYTLRAETQTTGVASIFKSYQLSQTSTGAVTKQGLRPQHYKETKTDSSGTQTVTASFDWAAQKIHFAGGRNSPLPDQTQDVLSLPYQLSQFSLNLDNLPISLSNGRKLDQYFIAIDAEETISTAMGELRTIPLRKVGGAKEDGLIIWLALEYRLLPVKMLYLDKTGKISATLVITDIRVSDE